MNFRSVFLEPNLLEFVSTGSDRISTLLLHDFTSRSLSPEAQESLAFGDGLCRSAEMWYLDPKVNPRESLSIPISMT